ncbi:hypothetical protein PAHAL_7G293100 [Panicum hallii]|uniref:Uncharacterized protein n=1 Tax=Panicum hallii TaxID=206008 RepID=A0A2S3IAD4_9POAL|nr:hypothetical protein PAHAL_7G293100 [Panicum hallii]
MTHRLTDEGQRLYNLGDGEFEDQFLKKGFGGTTVFLHKKMCTCFMVIYRT